MLAVGALRLGWVEFGSSNGAEWVARRAARQVEDDRLDGPQASAATSLQIRDDDVIVVVLGGREQHDARYNDNQLGVPVEVHDGRSESEVVAGEPIVVGEVGGRVEEADGGVPRFASGDAPVCRAEVTQGEGEGDPVEAQGGGGDGNGARNDGRVDEVRSGDRLNHARGGVVAAGFAIIDGTDGTLLWNAETRHRPRVDAGLRRVRVEGGERGVEGRDSTVWADDEAFRRLRLRLGRDSHVSCTSLR